MRKIYSLVLIAAGLLIGTQGWAQTNTCKIGTQGYPSVAAAIAAVPANGIQTTITMINDEIIGVLGEDDVPCNYCVINKEQNVVLDLNGCTISAEIKDKDKAHAVIMNQGTLQIRDGLDLDKKGSGGGTLKLLISCNDYYNAAQDLILNNGGQLEIKSGYYELTAPKADVIIGYIVDNNSTVGNSICTIEGGRFWAHRYTFRQFANSSICLNIFNIIGGDFTADLRSILYTQDTSKNQSHQITVNVSGGTFHVKPDQALIGLESSGENVLQNTSINVSGGVCSGRIIIIDHLNTTEETFFSNNNVQELYDKIFQITGGTFVDKNYTVNYGSMSYNPETGHWDTEIQEEQEHVLPTIIDGSYYKPNPTGNQDVPTEIIINHIENKPVASVEDLDDDKDAAYTIGANGQVALDITSNTEAYNIVVKNSSVVTVKNGAVLTVGDGGITVEDGSKIIVEAGGILKVGEYGFEGSGADALIVYSNPTASGVVTISPMAYLHQNPQLTVKMKTRAYHSESGYVFQYFAIPMTTASSLDWPSSVNTFMYNWDVASQNWVKLTNTGQINEPFRGYIFTNSAANNQIEYTLTGVTNGRSNAALTLYGEETSSANWNFFGNSYLSPIDLKEFFKCVKYTGVESTVYIYDASTGSYEPATSNDLEDYSCIPPMNAFFMNLQNSANAGVTINYETCVWGKENVIPMYAPSRTQSANKVIRISVKGGKNTDKLSLFENSDCSNDFDNGFDATKFMNDGTNIYAVTNERELAKLATNDLNGTNITFQADNAVEYTMTISNNNCDGYVLVDNLTNAQVAMTDGATYTFVATPNETTENRFEIRKAGGVVTNLAEMKAAHAVKGIYTATGQYVGKADRWSTLPAGMYIVDGVRMAK